MSAAENLLNRWNSIATGDSSARETASRILLDGESIARNGRALSPREQWINFLETTRMPAFLTSLGSDEERIRWSELAFQVLQKTNYTLLDMMEQRVKQHPGKVLFRDMTGAASVEWTYEQIYRHIREIAAVLHISVKGEPRVALYTENCLEGACTDLACLCYEIFVTPLNTHFSPEILTRIFDRLKITAAVADTRERLLVLQKIRQKTKKKFQIYSLLQDGSNLHWTTYLPGECKKISTREIESVLSGHRSARNNRVATALFTSGSTGLPKGVTFSVYNIVSKRFARAAALPAVGEETFLCYLPLYHTFGRYLELTGAIFWNGTYVFAGNTSAETLFSLFPKINPTGFISIPLRWQELYEVCLERIRKIESRELREKTIRDVVGQRLRWGLSAAGFLDPAVFRFFNQYGINLCSGFGMTEATGGITMTPPGNYREKSVGIPLPGVYVRLSEESELQIRGHYIGKYLEDAGPGDTIPYPISAQKDYWLQTGDVFKQNQDGYFEIVDRIKDIYKNNRGQTVAPQVIEKKFLHVPGIKSTFVVGDSRPYNVLLIVPDRKDPLFKSLSGENVTEYFHRIVMSANSDVAPYERVINFTLLNRDFSGEKGEVTPKGSFNRKTIEKNFSKIIDTLYKSNIVTLKADNLTVTIPRWFFRDLGILETDIVVKDHKLFNRRDGLTLKVRRINKDFCRIGDLKYRTSSDVIDLGLMARQPKLWMGNCSLVAFSPVKEGWDAGTGGISEMIYYIDEPKNEGKEKTELKSVRDENLEHANACVCRSYTRDEAESLKATEELGTVFARSELRLAIAIRHRLVSLAFHPSEEVRALAYRIILLKAPFPDLIPFMPAFFESGLSFLNEKSIREIVAGNMGKHRLDALKQRLYWYRNNLHWPAPKKVQVQFEGVLRMLFEFAVHHTEYYVPIRAELSRWILHRKDSHLSRKAEKFFNLLADDFDRYMTKRFPKVTLMEWKRKLIFEHGIPESEKGRITRLFHGSTFLQESILLTFNESEFDLSGIPAQGIWVMRLQAFKAFNHYRISINTKSGKHFELHMVLSEDPSFRPNNDTFYWMASLAGFPYGPAVAPFLGSSRPLLGALTTQYIGGLTAWDKIREYAEIHKSAGYLKPNAWKKIFTRAFTVVFKAWHHSGFQIVPGLVTPANIVVPEMDFRESAVIVSLTGWTRYTSPFSLIQPMLHDFYLKTAGLYPWCRKQLDIRWIFDAATEALGKEEAIKFLTKLRDELRKKPVIYFDKYNLLNDVEKYLDTDIHRYLPLPLHSAIDQYAEWHKMNPSTTPAAKEQTVFELMELFKLQIYPELIRYYFYRYSYFAESSEEILSSFDHLIRKMQSDPSLLPIQMLELSELQSALVIAEDKNVFSRMVFPRLLGEQNVDLLKVGETLKEHVIVRFNVTDKRGGRYIQREPIEPREVGQLYQLFFRENYPKEISETDNHFVVVDENEKIIGGLTWRYLDPVNVLLDGIVVTSSLQGRRIASGMINNFFASMGARGVKVIKAHFLFGNYYLKHYFEVDKKWGALVKTL